MANIARLEIGTCRNHHQQTEDEHLIPVTDVITEEVTWYTEEEISLMFDGIDHRPTFWDQTFEYVDDNSHVCPNCVNQKETK